MSEDTIRKHSQPAAWQERYSGGSAEAEYEEFQQLAHGIMQVQATVRKRVSSHGVPHPIQRAFHAKATLAVDDAELRFHDDLPADLQVGCAQPGARYRATVRLSNASGSAAADFAPDLRGIALRVAIDDDTSIDLLATNFPVSHARNARQFVEFAKATAGGSRIVGLARLAGMFGMFETVRMVRNVETARKQRVKSVATQTYWSRGALTWGQELAVRYLLRPAGGTPQGPEPSKTDPNYLSTEAARRLAEGDISFELCIQRYVNDQLTPIEDTAVEWSEKHSPAEPVATLTIKRADVRSTDAQARAEAVEQLAFNPWNTTDDFRPLGNLNRARKTAYDASAAHRAQTRWLTEPPERNVVLGALARAAFQMINPTIPWYRLPVRLAVLNLDAFRGVLRAHNLIDTEPHEAPPQPRSVPPPIPEDVRTARTADGRYNDMSVPRMGAVGATFGRNLNADYRPDLFNEPNPVVVSEKLLTRERFLPAGFLNVIAAAWIQFQVHDWVSHARYRLGERDVEVPLPSGMTWANTPGGEPESKMRIAGNKALSVASDGTERLFADATSHWWDGSEVYGSDPEKMAALREGPKIRLTDDGYLPTDLSGMELTGFNESWWLGLGALHTMFAREHNVVCDELRTHYPTWSDDRVFNTARLVVSALIAKIHTVEWTPAILATEPIDVGLHTNWNGPPSDWITKLGIWLMDVHSSVGIPSTTPDHHGTPYSLTEDFVTVYRMHPLIPDDYRFADHQSGDIVQTREFGEITGAQADKELRSLGLASTLYSFGIAHPGAITLNNYPQALRSFVRDGERIDLSVVDLVRTRRRGVPRYNDFRTGLHKPRLRHWEQLSEDPEAVRRLREVYRSIDEVDTMIGLYAEAPPEGFGFSDTAFRIFILMASRRIQSDRFLTVDFRPEIYSPLGMDWVRQNDMSTVILRHCPDLAALLPRGQSAFAPWRTVAAKEPKR
ncbi:peroxidase family protein [Mycobacterium sp. 852002-51057_SCH5723018]|uniref:peroxidase family protein n=1 Tax=Mycobacterium sp. 852002-51057_SCH5723018 TaxID=1834094 RepID=UPI0007FCA330|nr:peroxidase family protein [Mycobacterium sp. 852002-51057_SCH5723018]OBG30226.1 peroxidase [Mycobacterium sp. 852002-51057_SCH5723018]